MTIFAHVLPKGAGGIENHEPILVMVGRKEAALIGLELAVDVWFPHEWRAFDDGEMWFAGLTLWLWEPSWFEPRLAFADPEEGGDWLYLDGTKVGESGEAYPTHCCPPTQPPPPV